MLSFDVGILFILSIECGIVFVLLCISINISLNYATYAIFMHIYAYNLCNIYLLQYLCNISLNYVILDRLPHQYVFQVTACDAFVKAFTGLWSKSKKNWLWDQFLIVPDSVSSQHELIACRFTDIIIILSTSTPKVPLINHVDMPKPAPYMFNFAALKRIHDCVSCVTGASLFTRAGNIRNWVSCEVVGTHQGRGWRRQWITRGGGIRGLSDASAEESGADERRASNAARGEPLSAARARWEPRAVEFAVETGRAWGDEWRWRRGWWWGWWRIPGSELPIDMRIFK